MPGFLRSSLISVAATFASLAAGFASNIIVGRMLGPGGSGTVALAIWVAMSASAIADMGLPQTLLRNAGAASGRGDVWKGLVHSAFRAFMLSVSITCLAILAYGAFAGDRNPAAGWTWAITAALFVTYAFAAFSTAVARARNRFGQTGINTVIGGLLQVPLVLLGAWFWGAAGALIGHVARYLPQALRLNAHLRQPAVPLTPAMRGYAGNMWLSDLIDIMILSRIELLFLGIFFSATQMGYFAAGLALGGLIEQVILQISPVLIVGFADAHARGDLPALRDMYQRVMRVVALIMLPVSLGGAAIMPLLLPMIFGPLFQPAVPAAVILMASVWPAALSIIPWGMIGATGHSGQILRIQIWSGVLTILLLLLIVPRGGLEGAAWSRAGVGIATFGLLAVVAHRRAGTPLPWAALAKTMLAAGLCAGAAALAVIGMQGIAALIVAVLAGGVVYAVAIRLLGLIAPEDAQMLMDGMAARLPAPVRRALSVTLGLLVAR